MAQFHFIGGDGKTYGPYSREQMQQFMAENRVNAQTQVSADGGAWQPAGQYPELAGTTGAPAAPGMPQPMATDPAASILCILCDWGCCCLGIGAGIWAIVVLSKPEVKAVFR
jgi:hypothetical protein